ncbi:MAG: hypothetical protein ACTSU5_17350 [Promethearchaeota archaeon]
MKRMETYKKILLGGMIPALVGLVLSLGAEYAYVVNFLRWKEAVGVDSLRSYVEGAGVMLLFGALLVLVGTLTGLVVLLKVGEKEKEHYLLIVLLCIQMPVVIFQLAIGGKMATRPDSRVPTVGNPHGAGSGADLTTTLLLVTLILALFVTIYLRKYAGVDYWSTTAYSGDGSRASSVDESLVTFPKTPRKDPTQISPAILRELETESAEEKRFEIPCTTPTTSTSIPSISLGNAPRPAPAGFDVGRLEKLIKISNRVKIDDMAVMLNMQRNDLLLKILDWGDEFNFKIDGDFVNFDASRVDEFINQLDESFRDWSASSTKL